MGMSVGDYTRVKRWIEKYFPIYLNECDLDEDRMVDSFNFAEECVALILKENPSIDPQWIRLIAKQHVENYYNQF